MTTATTDTSPKSAPILSFEDITDRLVITEPRISPDGKNVAFTVTMSSRKGETRDRAIWISRDRKPATRFTGGDANNQDPQWSTDGSKLLFLANRKVADKDGLYVLPIDGGEAQRLGDLEGSLSDATWSPDGTMVAVLRTDSETEAEKKKREDKDDSIVYEEDIKRARLWIVDVATGNARQLTFGTPSIWSYAWSPDGDRLVIVTTELHTVNEMIREMTLWQVRVSGGLLTRITSFPGGASSPVVRERNGELVVAVSAHISWKEPVSSLWIVPLQGGAPENLTPGHRGTLYKIVADPSDRTGLFLRFVEGTHQRLYRTTTAGGTLDPITPSSLTARGTISSGPSISADGSTIAFTWEASDRPGEVFVADLGGEPVGMSNVGAPFVDRLVAGEVVSWESTDGVSIEGILIRPLNIPEGHRVPLIVEIHGGPSWQWEDGVSLSWHDWAQMLVAHGYAVLLPNPRGSTGYGVEFEQLLQGDVGGGEAQDVISGALAMVERGIADPERLGIAGWSWGGYLTAWTITQTNIFRAAVMGAGVANLISDHAAGDIPEANMQYYPGHPYTDWDLYARATPIRYAANVKTPTLILHGDGDTRVHPTQGQEYYRALKVVGIPVQFVRYPREGHGFQERAHQIDLLRRIVAWFEKYIPA